MDEFGVLTERFGLKPQGKSTPMAASKFPTTTVNSQATPNLGSNSSLNPKPSSNPNSFNGSFLDDHGFPYSNPKSPNFGDDFDFFGGFNKNSINSKTNGFGFDYDSLFSKETAPEAKSSFDDDIFGGFKSSSSSVYNKLFFGFGFGKPNNTPNNNGDDIFGPFAASKPKNSEPVDDLLGNFSSKTKSTSWNGSIGTDDLIPGFGSRKGENKGTFKSVDDPFVVLESVSTSKFLHPPEDMSHFNNGRKSSGSSLNIPQPLRPPPKPGQVLKTDKSKISDIFSIDELEKFAMGGVQKNNGHLDHRPNREVKERESDRVSKCREADGPAWMTQQKSADDLDSFFGVSSHSSSIPKDPVFGTESVHTSSGIKKSSSVTNVVDISLMFGDLSSFGEFEEVEGDSEERRRLRFERYRRTQDRVVKAINDMTQRDIQNTHEQEERRRISDSVDIEIKRWAAGKEGNLRALLSSLQCVLWRESGWEPVSLTDLITSTSVKKVYRKANLCIHPDKVQQKRATLQQKYTAEKVFDILKEAYNKFQKQELS